MPTRMGGYLNGLIFLMFLLSVGYGNNLFLIFTLFLFGFNLLWLIQTHFYLNSFKGLSLVIGDSFAKENAHIHLRWEKTPSNPTALEISLEMDDHSFPVNQGMCKFPSRGVWCFTHLKLATDRPYGLYRAWIYFPLIDTKAFVYPERLKDVPPLDSRNLSDEGELAAQEKGLHDFWGIGPYQGEELRHISWKHYARFGSLLIKEGEKHLTSEIHFRYHPELPEKELELSRMATQMVYCHDNDIRFSLETARTKKASDRNHHHLKECLRELSRC